MDTVKESIKEVEDFSIRMMDNEELVVLYLSIKNKQTNRAYEALPPRFKMSKASFLMKLNRLQEMGLINLIKVSQGRIHTIAVQPLLRHPEIVEEEVEVRGLLGD
jgi:DNA-binding transcriptional ArsR family regulator